MKTRYLVLCLCLITAACVKINPQPSQEAATATPAVDPTIPGMPNPASVYCIQQGYRVEIRTDADGNQFGVCIFPDGSECDEWAFYRNECGPGNSSGSMPNPASAYCVQQGYKSEIRTAPDGSQIGVCIFPDGSECDEWAYYRGECSPHESPQGETTGWETYTNPEMGYTFEYPAGAEIVISDEPKKSMLISGTGMDGETWGVSHPTDMAEYRPPGGTDLYQWLADHYLLGETRLFDEQIAGTTAIHFRHEASPQSPADDRYYFARDGQLYMLLIGHSGLDENWDLNNRFLRSFQFIPPATGSILPTSIPTALPIDPSTYLDWATYTYPVYGFTLRLPDGWTAEEDPTDALLAGHELILRPIIDSSGETIRLTFRGLGEETLLWPTGVGQGEFIPAGSLAIAGEPAMRVLLVCPTGEITEVWYHQAEDQPTIQRGDMEFGIIYSTPGHCEPGKSLVGKALQLGETIISSFNVP